MKRILCLLTVLCLCLCACASAPAQTTAPAETTAPVETTIPVETTVPVETAAPTETTQPTEAADAQPPIRAEYAEEDFSAYHAYWSDETDYITSIGFTATETLTDVRFCQLTWNESDSYDAEVLYTIDTMTPDHPFLAQVTFWGDMTTYGLSFTDADGNARHFAVMISGKDGSLICSEYLP